MLDSRDLDRDKYAPISLNAFQLAQNAPSPPVTSPKRLRSSSDVEGRRETRAQSTTAKQRRYRAEDFHYSASTRDKIDSWFLQYPVLRKRNFYTIQNHHATAKHFDLRLHVSGGLFSFAIPRGFSLPNSPNSSGPKDRMLSRLAVETSIHPLNYALFEGVGRTGTTAVWDIGEYRVHPTKKKERLRNQLLNQGFDDGDTTSSEVEDSYDEGEENIEHDEKQEELLRKALERSSFSAGTIQTEKVRKVESRRDGGETRGFVLELLGERYRGLRFTLARSSSNFETVKRKTTGVLYRSPRWYCILHDPSGTTPLARVENPKISRSESLLTGRTMQEIATDGGWKGRPSQLAKKVREAKQEETTDEEVLEEKGKGKEWEEEEDVDGKETQGLLDVEGDELMWFEERAKRKKGR
ncbi:hypothetical protein JCM16303_001795 [Sporobolomyces ruberrimus]